MLGEDELASGTPADPSLCQLPEYRIEDSIRAPVEHESGDGVFHDVGYEGIGGPPIARTSRGRSHLLLGHRVDPLAEQEVIHSVDDRVIGLGSGDLTKA